MDSMRHLSKSLPTARRKQDQPELLADFRAAALSVTNLYKSAAASQDKAKAAGYQDALEDLLAFLDKENLGLMDGEGWRVRQWATERLPHDGLQRPAASDDDEETVVEQQRSTSPEGQRKPSAAPPLSSSELSDDNPTCRTAMSEPPHSQAQTPPPLYPNTHVVPSLDDFTFRSTNPYPTNHDRDATPYNMDLDNASTAPSSTENLRFITRPTRSRHSNHQRQRGNASSNISLNLGAGAGSKRKVPYSDFFDISGLHSSDTRDGREGKGGKRGRHI